ncbi:MAG: P1 family peptidase, partial [Anaerolineae bacterium]|nr:P1 family peptidase [Anaerolineae bacterium]
MSDVNRPRLRDLGVDLSDQFPTGLHNAITDVPGVRVGQVTLPPGPDQAVRTGVTAILPHPGNLFEENVYAAVHTLNGYGKAAGFEQVREMGVIEAPILLTNTLSVGAVLAAAVRWLLRENPRIGDDGPSVNVVVGECNDSYLNDMRGLHVQREHVWAALEQAVDGPVAEGAVGAGAGTACFQFKGGIGT